VKKDIFPVKGRDKGIIYGILFIPFLGFIIPGILIMTYRDVYDLASKKTIEEKLFGKRDCDLSKKELREKKINTIVK
jgi:hypothetical protein